MSRMRRATASATSSRGASSSTKRSPSASSSSAPSPRTASVTRKPSAPFAPETAVGWNCIISRSASAAPAACASTIPAPTAPTGLVVRDHSAAAPPVARTTARAETTRSSCRRTPAQRPAVVGSATARQSSSTWIRSCSATSADSWRVTRRPVAAPPACTIRRTECPPSRPSERRALRSASKRTPSRSRSRTAAGASLVRISAALRRTVPRPARSVSSRCRSRVSSSCQHGSQAALRPVARRLRSGVALTSATRPPAAAAVSAAYRPAAPAPTTATSASIVREPPWGQYGTQMPRPVYLSHRLARARHRGASGARCAHRGDRAGAGAP